MNYLFAPHQAPRSAERRFVLSLLVFALPFLLLLPGLPTSSAPETTKNSRDQRDGIGPVITIDGSYRQTNLVSDLPGVALVEDRLLRNPWGVASGPTSPFWVVNNKTDSATVYKSLIPDGPVTPNLPLPSVAIPNVPTFAPAPALPTGVVANTTSSFPVALTPTSPAAPAQFIFATLSGGINAWQPELGPVAMVVRFMSGHSYTGLALGNNASGNFLYAADFANGKVDVFDNNFNPSSVSGNFDDATIPTNFHPFNIQNLGGALYVTYAEFQHGLDVDFGFVRKFDTNGIRDTSFAINNGPLTNPWGLALAPASFGAFSNRLLVGNFRSRGIHDPSISAFDPATGALIGSMVDESGAALEIENLRALVFGNGGNGGDLNTLYFSAGISFAQHGLFGSLTPATAVAATLIKFSDTNYFTNEGAGHIDITVTRTGDVSGTAQVNYATVDESVAQKSDYEIAVGTLKFNPGETTKTFRVLIVDDHQVGGGSSLPLRLVLSNAIGAALVVPNQALLSIMDNEGDTPGQPPNIIDDTPFFVRQQYFDFLNREPDAAGFAFWTNQITSCGTDPQCIEVKRINVSAAFFLSIEFQRTGMVAYMAEKAAFGGLPRYGSFMRDVQALQKDFAFGLPGADAQLEANKQAFFDEFVRRPEFLARYSGLTNAQYVSRLFANAELATSTGELYIAELTSAQTVPPSGSPARGLVILRQLVTAPTVSVSLYFNGLTSAETEAHIHGPAVAGSNGPVIVTLPNGQFGDFRTSLGSQSINLGSGRIYVDVHTQNFPNGEIRGQLPSNLFIIDMITRSLDAGIINHAQALRLITESDRLKPGEVNRAFVLMQYFGYLRRNPDDAPDNNLTGFNFWLAKLNEFNGNFIKAEMVQSFLKSTEYRGRFGPP